MAEETLQDLLLTGQLGAPDSTIKPGPSSDPEAQQAVQRFMACQAGSTVRELGRVLGRGGMGVVRLGVQPSLGREVAVKTLKPDHSEQVHLVQLLQEGWLTGRLEHPNIVPVHDAGIDGDGNPQLLLKRIEGWAWSELMHSPKLIQLHFGQRDPLEWNLQTLLAVCDAMRFAHDRGVLHRDIKPENVMVGAFGEVYVVDWGVAVALEPDPEGRLPQLPAQPTVVGTPSYVAPEMLRGQASTACDVYLLGGVLYELLSGQPPHAGSDLAEVIAAAKQPVHLHGPAPYELRRLCEAALSVSPQDRPDVALFAKGVRSYLQHRGAVALIEQATLALEQMERACAADDPDDAEVHQRYAACSFGFQAGLQQWPEHPTAAVLLDRAVACMVRFEIGQGDLHSARRLLDALSGQRPELRSALEQAEAEAERQRVVIEKLRRDVDPSVGRRSREMLVMVSGVAFTVVPLTVPARWGWVPGANTYAEMAWTAVGFVLLLLALVALRWRAIKASAFNRMAISLLVLAPVGQLGLAGAGWALQMPTAQITLLHYLWWAGLAAAGAISLQSWLWICAISYLLAFPISVGWPWLTYPVMSIANAVFTLNVLWLWRRPRPPV